MLPRGGRRLVSLVLAGCFLAGCVTSTAVSRSSSNEISVRRTQTGLIWGPCMPAPGKISVAYDFQLIGDRAVYAADEFVMFRESDGRRYRLAVREGSIAIDPARHRVRFDLSVGNRPWEFNGEYPLSDSSKA